MLGAIFTFSLGDRLLGIRAAGHATLKVHFEFFGAKKRKEIDQYARSAYEGHYVGILELVPEERRLENKLDSGWEPLCEFLGKDIPDVECPDREMYTATVKEKHLKLVVDGWNVVKPWVFTIAALGVGILIVRTLNDIRQSTLKPPLLDE